MQAREVSASHQGAVRLRTGRSGKEPRRSAWGLRRLAALLLLCAACGSAAADSEPSLLGSGAEIQLHSVTAAAPAATSTGGGSADLRLLSPPTDHPGSLEAEWDFTEQFNVPGSESVGTWGLRIEYAEEAGNPFGREFNRTIVPMFGVHPV